MNATWIDEFLPLMQCPDTRQSLRWARADELVQHGLTTEDQALVSEDGTRFFTIDAGIPLLLPKEKGS